MAALMKMIILLMIVEISCGLFYNTLSQDQYNLNPYQQSNVTCSGGLNETKLAACAASEGNQWTFWNLIINPTTWTSSGFWTLLVSIIVVAGGTGIVIGTIFGIKSDLLYLFSFFIFLTAMGAIPISNLYLVITSDVTIYGCEIGMPCYPAMLTAFFFSGILAIMWIAACISWWSGREW